MHGILLIGALIAAAPGNPIGAGATILDRSQDLLRHSPAVSSTVADCPEIGITLRGTSAPLTCACPAIAARDLEAYGVWGNQVYTDDSNICVAAIHDGRITTSGGRVTVWAVPGQARYPAATRNGKTSIAYVDGDGSFRFSDPALASRRAAPVGKDRPADAVAARDGPRELAPAEGYPAAPVRRTRAADCPAIGTALRGTRSAFTCTCPSMEAEDLEPYGVWGDRIYTDDSNICVAAIHDGRITRAGGLVTLWAAPGQRRYLSTTRNGKTSIAYVDGDGSFRFTPPPARKSRRRAE